MVDRLIDYFLSEPRRLVALGAALVRFAGLLLVAGLVGEVATTAVSAVKGLAGAARVDVPLADVLPNYLSVWMPESLPTPPAGGPGAHRETTTTNGHFAIRDVLFLMSALGFGLALLLLAAGLVAARTGRVYERYMGT